MKLRITPNDFGPGFSCIDDNEYDGAPDAGPQLVGHGNTEKAAEEDFTDQRLERQAERELKAAAKNAASLGRRQSAIEESRAAGRGGAFRVPDTTLFGHGDPTDTAIMQMVDGLFEGRAEREASAK